MTVQVVMEALENPIQNQVLKKGLFCIRIWELNIRVNRQKHIKQHGLIQLFSR